jgi:NADPH:quinone reductase
VKSDIVNDPRAHVVGGESFYRSTRCIAFEGRIVVVGFASGDIPSAALDHALVKNYSILGLQGRTYRFLDIESIRDYHDELTKLVAAGLIRPLISERLSLSDVPDGLRRLAAGSTTGRLVFLP